MNIAKKALVNTKNFVADHKIAIAIVATAAATTVAVVKLKNNLDGGYIETANEFLTEKGLMEEFTERYFEQID